MPLSDSPVVIAVAESTNGDLEGLPNWVQRILHHLCFVADGKPAEKRCGKEERVENEKGEKGRKKGLYEVKCEQKREWS